MTVVDSNSDELLFAQGGEIDLAFASRGITALLIPSGRTALSRFSIPFLTGKELAELISKAKLIIHDEAPMVNNDDQDGANDSETTIEIMYDLLITGGFDPIQTIIEAIYPYILYYQHRVILAPTHEIVDNMNEHILSLLPGDEKVYLSSDSICKTDEGIFRAILDA
ncbi:hypothetical protein V2J09_011193 [Rumex salicifolius]